MLTQWSAHNAKTGAELVARKSKNKPVWHKRGHYWGWIRSNNKHSEETGITLQFDSEMSYFSSTWGHKCMLTQWSAHNAVTRAESAARKWKKTEKETNWSVWGGMDSLKQHTQESARARVKPWNTIVKCPIPDCITYKSADVEICGITTTNVIGEGFTEQQDTRLYG